jgi:DNA-binding LytR/AlgR family response regulator
MIRSQCIQSHVYEFNYDGVRMNIAYEDIYYLEKNEKMVYFYTKKGVFHKRDSMNALEEIFKEFGFLRVHVSYIVNSKYIVAWYKDEVELINKVLIPVSEFFSFYRCSSSSLFLCTPVIAYSAHSAIFVAWSPMRS